MFLAWKKLKMPENSVSILDRLNEPQPIIFIKSVDRKASMNVLDAIALRRTTRSYQPLAPSQQLIFRVLSSIEHTPSSGNIQNWKVLIISDQAKRLEIAKASQNQLWMANAPYHLVICADQEVARQFFGVRGEHLFSIQNCAAYVQNLLLSATHFGLASAWVSSFDEEELHTLIELPERYRAQAIVTLGFAKELVPPPTIRPMSEYVYFEKFGQNQEQQSFLDEIGRSGDANVERVEKVKHTLGAIKTYLHEKVKKHLGKK
jgi:nitroreductase